MTDQNFHEHELSLQNKESSDLYRTWQTTFLRQWR